MSQGSEFGWDIAAFLKALGAAAAGRGLLLLSATHYDRLSWGQLTRVVLYEMPIIGSVAFVGYHVAPMIGSADEHSRAVVTALIAAGGQRVIDMILARVLQVSQPPPPPPPPPPPQHDR